jgi:hypothetical protein
VLYIIEAGGILGPLSGLSAVIKRADNSRCIEVCHPKDRNNTEARIKDRRDSGRNFHNRHILVFIFLVLS